MKSIIDELAAYRLKVERDGREIVNVPGFLALPGVLAAPKLSILGTVAASLLGCDIHLENEGGKRVDVGKAVKEAAKTVRDEIGKAWDELSADDPEECAPGEENEEEPSGQDGTEEDIPTIRVKPDDSGKE